MKLALNYVKAGMILNKEILDNMRFAEHIDLVAESSHQQQELTHSVHDSIKNVDLQISVQKTKTMTFGKRH